MNPCRLPPVPNANPRSPVGQLLRNWRAARGMSQLDLALHAGFSARHVSFIETGRTQPSRQALLALAETLEMPLRESNRLLEAGGYAHVYRQTPFAADEMSHIRGVLQFILDSHQPYPAVVLDRYSNCLMGNGASERMLAAMVDPSLITEHANYLRMVFHPLGARRFIVNWDELGPHLLTRAERELGVTLSTIQPLRSAGGVTRYAGARSQQRRRPRLGPADLLLPIHFAEGGIELRLFTTIMTLGTPQDVTLQELRIETFFPADAASASDWTRFSHA